MDKEASGNWKDLSANEMFESGGWDNLVWLLKTHSGYTAIWKNGLEKDNITYIYLESAIKENLCFYKISSWLYLRM